MLLESYVSCAIMFRWVEGRVRVTYSSHVPQAFISAYLYCWLAMTPHLILNQLTHTQPFRNLQKCTKTYSSSYQNIANTVDVLL